MDGQPVVVSAESPEHYKMQINCMCPDKKYDASFIIATKESLLDMEAQARWDISYITIINTNTLLVYNIRIVFYIENRQFCF